MSKQIVEKHIRMRQSRHAQAESTIRSFLLLAHGCSEWCNDEQSIIGEDLSSVQTFRFQLAAARMLMPRHVCLTFGDRHWVRRDHADRVLIVHAAVAQSLESWNAHTLQMSPLFIEKTLSSDRDKQGTTAYAYMRLLYHCMHSRLHAELLIANATHVEFVLSHFQKFGHSSQKKKKFGHWYANSRF